MHEDDEVGGLCIFIYMGWVLMVSVYVQACEYRRESTQQSRIYTASIHPNRRPTCNVWLAMGWYRGPSARRSASSHCALDGCTTEEAMECSHSCLVW